MSHLGDLLQTAASLSSGAPDPSVAFASPIAVAGAALARMEGVIGTPEESVGEGTGDSKRVYPVVLIQGSDRTICFGSVGVGSASFCIRKDCKVKAHLVNKVDGFEGDSFHIARAVGATVFAQPSVRKDQVPSTVQADWKGKQWSLAKWVRAFQAVSNADDGTATHDDIKGEVNVLAKADLFKTPSKKRKSERGDDVVKPLSSMTVAAYLRTLPVGGSSDLEALIAQGSPALNKGGLARIVARLETGTSDLGKSIGEVANLPCSPR